MGTTNMNLTQSSVGVTSGPDWATNTEANWSAIDTHDHSSGKGVQISPAGININADLEFNANDATELRTVAFDSSASATSSADRRCFYEDGGDIYWRNASGTAVQITSGTAVGSGVGSIDGMGGTQAQVQYNDTAGQKSYSFIHDKSASPKSVAKMAFSDTSLYNFSNSNYFVQLKFTGTGSSAILTVPDETGTLLTTATSFAGAISIAATGGSNTITLDAEGDINLDSNTGVLTFKDNGTAIGKISNSSSDLVIENEVDAKDIIFKQYDGNEVVRMADDRRLYFYDKGGEYIYGDGSTLYIIAGSSVNFSSGTLSSVNDLNTDVISVDDAAVGLNVDFSGGNNTTSKITLKDNVADALNITEGSNSYIKFVTTDSSEQIVFGKDVDINGGTINGTNINVSAGTLTTSTAQKEAIVDGGKGNLTKSDVGLSNVTNDAQVPASGGSFSGNVSFGDNNITNVGDISLDTISSDAGTSIGVTLGTDSGDNFNVGSGKLVVEGDTGNVGINTTAPGLSGTATHKYLTIVNSETTGNVDRPAILELACSNSGEGVHVGKIDFWSDIDDGDDHVASIICAQEGTTSNNVGGRFRFQVKEDGGSLSDRLTIGAAGIALKPASSGGQITISTGGLVWSYFAANSDVQTNSSGQLITTSDKNKKRDLGKIESGQGLNVITQMQAHRYNFLDDLENGIDIPTIGFFAQDLHAINPEIGMREIKEINGKEEELWGVNSKGILAYMVEAIKELSAKVNALEGA
jgi:hypothetical protein